MVTLQVESNLNIIWFKTNPLARRGNLMSAKYPVKFGDMMIEVQTDRLNQICDFIFPRGQKPARVGDPKVYEKFLFEYEMYTANVAQERSYLINKYRGRPIELVLGEIYLYCENRRV